MTPWHLLEEGSRPRNSFFFGGTKLVLPGARPGSKTNFVVAKLYVHFFTNWKYTDRYCKLYFHNKGAAVILGCVIDCITNIPQKCTH